tara:strand:- start:16760 stop:18331 length:1572 start_codon:yes stop_codon:yes gene_type:complete
MNKIRIYKYLSFLVLLLSLIFIYPTFQSSSLPNWWSYFFPSNKINLGLDLRGGIFVVLGLDKDTSSSVIVEKEASKIKLEIVNKKILFRDISTLENNQIVITFYDNKSLENVRNIFGDSGDYNIRIEKNSIIVSLQDEFLDQTKSKLLQQVKNILTNRIDQFGVIESSIQLSGKERIIVQIPGIEETDRERILNIISKTAMLEFKPVIEEGSSSSLLFEKYRQKGNKYSFYTGVNDNFIVTSKSSKLKGESIEDASVSYDEFNRPYVSFSLNKLGSNVFSKLTKDNLGKKIAIILDGKVKSTPVVQSQIFGSGSISGSFSFEEANDLAIILKSGSLPIPIIILQEKTIGPSLGTDSVNNGKNSMILASILIFFFMIFYYKRLGLVCDLALVFNLICIFGLLSLFGVTLTFPGIAGLVLTLGMAVDGNIIIYERIKEELKKGKDSISSVELGFDRSVSTILDANFTTLIAAICMFLLGDGPIKGFAVTLSIGIFSTIFSNIVVARILTKLLVRSPLPIRGSDEV